MQKPMVFALALCAGIAGCDRGGDDPPRSNAPPVLSAINDLTITANQVSAPVSITISDEQIDEVTVSAVSDLDRLLPESALTLTGAGGTRSLTLTPIVDETGMATITVSATDTLGQTTSASFLVTVTAEQRSLLTTTRALFAIDANDEPLPINAIEFNDDVGAEDFSDLFVQ